MRKNKTSIFLTLLLSVSVLAASIDLSGQWQFKLDPQDEGEEQSWFNQSFEKRINLPGSIQEQGYGKEIGLDTDFVWRKSVDFKNYPKWPDHPMYDEYSKPGNILIPYFLNPDRHYMGLAWFTKEVEIPENWEDKEIFLKLERVHWRSHVWIDSEKVGQFDSLAASHKYNCTNQLSSGRHKITIAVDNRMLYPIGKNSHSITNHTQTPWNGIIGAIELSAKPKLRISDVQVYPNVGEKAAKVELSLSGIEESEFGKLKISASSFNTVNQHKTGVHSFPVTAGSINPEIAVSLPMGEDVLLWDEFSPNLYRMNLSLNLEGRQEIAESAVFGMREIETEGSSFLVNGRKTFLRGTLECCIFPKTGYPSMDIEYWEKIMTQCKNYGLNHIRFHSWCPPEPAFEAADRAGVYLQPECNIWAGVKRRDSDIAAYVKAEWKRILKEYGNHPSFTLYGVGNEGWMKAEIMEELIRETKNDDRRRLYTGYANGFNSENTEYYIGKSVSVSGAQNLEALRRFRIRYQCGWPPVPGSSYLTSREPDTNLDYSTIAALYPKPLIQHETVQRCSYPDVDDIDKFTGSLTPGYLIIARDQLEERGMLEQNDDFVQASGKWQVKQFKEEIEAGLRTKGLGGFQLLDIHDFLGQGTALVGVLDGFWDSKGYVSGEEFRKFCSPVVPLLRMKKRVFTSHEQFDAKLEAANFSQSEISNTQLRWAIKDESGETVKRGVCPEVNLPVGNGHWAGRIRFNLSSLNAPAKYNISVSIPQADAENNWDFWVYPEKAEVPEPKDFIIAETLNAESMDYLLEGGKMLLLPEKDYIKGNVKPCFPSIYWNCPWTDGGESDTLGMLCDPNHPVFNDFPTDMHTNWQWWGLMNDCKPMILNEMPRDFRPAIQMIDDWHRNRKLGLLFEAKVGEGRVLVCCMDIESGLDERPVARQLKTSIYNYMQSDNFAPQQSISTEELRAVFN
ncbi:sugar-binding domain-containing protein [Sedimentisphaera salicampi]|uniref:sugar-binding domain-containing protein n=1 Tax=Sedimentisphaera salicampi TaxID=1941349 RepID=UPI000B9B6656|nr:sugar-binding domain-containing protein [Sedimentisphaera salicampi]OXU14870.1 Beta-galactosidase [Sedimentisphaera salicampi]